MVPWFYGCCRVEGELWAAGWHRQAPSTSLWLIPPVCTGQDDFHKNLTSSWSAPRVTEGKGCSGTCQTLKLTRENLPISCALCWFCSVARFQPNIRSLHSWCHIPLFSPPLDWADTASWPPEEVVLSSQWLQETSPSCPQATGNTLSPPLSLVAAAQWWMGRHTPKPPLAGVGYPSGVISSHLTGMKG